MRPFEQASYLAQVGRLRELAKAALTRYPFTMKNLTFVHLGENATFRIETKRGRALLLRIHRDDYHAPQAIREELAWLEHLSKDGLFSVPAPVRSKAGKLLEIVSVRGVPRPRGCSVLRWIEGRFIQKSLRASHMFFLGQMAARLHRKASKRSVVHRRYWDAEGLLGTRPKLGSIEGLKGVSPNHQAVISRARRFMLNRLKRFERRYPGKQGLIHGDLHFGNVFLTAGSPGDGRRLSVIDFDDCGFGFHAYDLAVPLLSAEQVLKPKHKGSLGELKKALIEGYASLGQWGPEDDLVLSDLMTARKLVMLGWFNSRSDNPRIAAYMKSVVVHTLRHFKEEYDLE